MHRILVLFCLCICCALRFIGQSDPPQLIMPFPKFWRDTPRPVDYNWNGTVDFLTTDGILYLDPGTPQSDWVMVDLGNLTGVKNVRLIDALGNVVYDQPTSSNRMRIELESFAQGIYHIQVSSSVGMFSECVVVCAQ